MNTQNPKGLKHFVIYGVLLVRGVCCSLEATKCDSFYEFMLFHCNLRKPDTIFSL